MKGKIELKMTQRLADFDENYKLLFQQKTKCFKTFQNYEY